MQLAKIALKVGWWFAARHNFSSGGGPDQSNTWTSSTKPSPVRESGGDGGSAAELQRPRPIQQVSPNHAQYMQTFSGTRDLVRQPGHTIYFIGVNSASSCVPGGCGGRFTGTSIQRGGRCQQGRRPACGGATQMIRRHAAVAPTAGRSVA